MSGPDELEIVALVNAFVDGWNAGDPVALAKPFAPDADYLNLMGLYGHGREVIVRAYRDVLTTAFRGSRIKATIEALRFVRPDVAMVDVTFDRQDAQHPPPIPLRTLAGILAVRNGGRWQILSYRSMVPFEGADRSVWRAFDLAPRSS